ncbi:hypothetical protein VN97_g1180 [Penicillium thymicola]|uniref:Uncharacterized protein n=1 Tax=Penicillium thymicola TaxID=293382 RepID=A0AAI9TSJ9_PENTH|nr:hypothetical protein VN97_g1180 [Penicillium thymicola]
MITKAGVDNVQAWKAICLSLAGQFPAFSNAGIHISVFVRGDGRSTRNVVPLFGDTISTWYQSHSFNISLYKHEMPALQTSFLTIYKLQLLKFTTLFPPLLGLNKSTLESTLH